MTTYNSKDAEAERRRARYDSEIWRGGLALLILLPLLSIAILHPALQEFEPFLGLGMGLVIVILGCRLIVITHRDAQIAQYGIQPKQEASFRVPSGEWEWAIIAVGTALVVSLPLGLIFSSPYLGGISGTTLFFVFFGLERILWPILEEFFKAFQEWSGHKKEKKPGQERT